MRNIYDVIVRPVITEKATEQLDRNQVYTFVVARQANKIEIAQAVEKLFNVKVDTVRTMQYRGKQRRVGRNVGQRPSWKKAVVTLRAGDTIEIFEGV
ncbi:MAG: 50S ribosomal protein L23 [Acidobacteria bacterium]|jgi:large subunit ribosomal protein L23|nr:50S ribosomal protein L23 [Acidobacteriota bacterium]